MSQAVGIRTLSNSVAFAPPQTAFYPLSLLLSLSLFLHPSFSLSWSLHLSPQERKQTLRDYSIPSDIPRNKPVLSNAHPLLIPHPDLQYPTPTQNQQPDWSTPTNWQNARPTTQWHLSTATFLKTIHIKGFLLCFVMYERRILAGWLLYPQCESQNLFVCWLLNVPATC